MEEKTITVGEKSYTIKELKYKDIAVVADMDKSTIAKSLMINATGITEEEYDNLSMKDGVKIMKVVNDLNGLTEGDFQ